MAKKAKMLSLADVKAEIAKIKAAVLKDDYELAHALEIALHQAVLKSIFLSSKNMRISLDTHLAYSRNLTHEALKTLKIKFERRTA